MKTIHFGKLCTAHRLDNGYYGLLNHKTNKYYLTCSLKEAFDLFCSQANLFQNQKETK